MAVRYLNFPIVPRAEELCAFGFCVIVKQIGCRGDEFSEFVEFGVEDIPKSVDEFCGGGFRASEGGYLRFELGEFFSVVVEKLGGFFEDFGMAGGDFGREIGLSGSSNCGGWGGGGSRWSRSSSWS